MKFFTKSILLIFCFVSNIYSGDSNRLINNKTAAIKNIIFHRALIAGDAKKVKELVQDGADVNLVFRNIFNNPRLRQIDKITPLQIALRFNHRNITRFLLQENVAVSENELYYVSAKFPEMSFNLFKQKIKTNPNNSTCTLKIFKNLVFHYLNKQNKNRLYELWNIERKYLKPTNVFLISEYTRIKALYLLQLITNLIQCTDNESLEGLKNNFKFVLRTFTGIVFLGQLKFYLSKRFELIYGIKRNEEYNYDEILLTDLIKMSFNANVHIASSNNNVNTEAAKFIKDEILKQFNVDITSSTTRRCCTLL